MDLSILAPVGQILLGVGVGIAGRLALRIADSRPAPRGFRWTDAPAARALLAVLIVTSLGLSIYASALYVSLVNCLNARDMADARRTRAIAVVTDREREADRWLLVGRAPDGTTDPIELRGRALTARDATDAVRAANPPPARTSCR